MKKIAIISGGTSGEREASLESANNIKSILEKKYIVSIYDYPHEIEFLSKKYDLYIPIIHGLGGEDGEITNILENYGKKYLFTSTQGHKICINKFITNKIVSNNNLTTPQTYIRTKYNKTNHNITLPVFIKPNKMGSSMFANIANTNEEVEIFCQKIINQYDDALIAEYIKGNEISVIVSNITKETNILSALRINTDKTFYTEENKELGKGVLFTPIQIAEIKTIEKSIINIYNKLQLKDVARFDFIQKDNLYYFLEINTIPGMSTHSILHNGLLHTDYKGLENFILQLVKNNIGV